MVFQHDNASNLFIYFLKDTSYVIWMNENEYM